MSLRRNLLRSTVLGGVISVVLVAPAFAQDPETQDPSVPADTEALQDSQTTAQDGDEVETIVVTGSRIRRDEFTSPSPIQVITKDVSTQAGLVRTSDIIQGSTIAQGSQQVDSLFSGFITDGGPGVQSISLRGLGAERTLVLLNGRRLAPAGVGGTAGAVADLNVLPSGILQRVEVLKDGASSVYGSDAVAGVVNAITLTNFDGFEFGAHRTFTEAGGGNTTSIDMVFGRQFDRGNFMLAAEYQDQEQLLFSDRDWAECGFQNLRDPDTGEVLDYREVDGNLKCVGGTQYGVVQTSFGILMPDPGSNFAGVVPGFRDIDLPPSGTGAVLELPNDSPLDDLRTLIYPTQLYTVSGFFNHDLDAFGGAEFYSEFLYNNRQTDQATSSNIAPIIPYGDPRSPGTLIVDAFGFPTGFGSVRPFIPVRRDYSQDVSFARAVAGLRGDFRDGFLNGWGWDAYYVYSRSDANYEGSVILTDRLENSLDVTAAGGGGYQCASAAARSEGCVPLGIFESRLLLGGQLTDAERDYIYGIDAGTTEFVSHQAVASITGDLMELPAGTLAGAFGVEFRRDSIDDLPGEISRSGNVYGSTSAQRTVGDESVYEIFAELEAPLINNVRFIEDLTASTSVRYTKYQETGFEDTTYKLGLKWTVNPSLTLRTTYGTSFRAPKLFELFLGAASGFYTGADPCDTYEEADPTTNRYQNCVSELGVPDPAIDFFASSTPEVFTYGARNRPNVGPFAGDLRAETSDAFTAGIIWNAPFADLNIALDYFDITVEDQIGALSAGSVLGQCYNLNPTEFRQPGTVCDLVDERTPYDPASGIGGTIAFINTSYLNIDSQRTAGFDLTARFTKDFSLGEFSIDNRTTLTTIDEFDLLGGNKDDFNGTIGNPELVSQTDFGLRNGDWRFFWRTSYISEQSDYQLYLPPNDDPSTSIYDIAVEEQWLHTVSVTYEADEWTATVGIDNITDKEPDRISPDAVSGFGNAALSPALDPFGRTLFVSFRKSF